MKQMEYIKNNIPASLIGLLLLLLGSCIAEKEQFGPEDPVNKGEEVAFTLRMPVETTTRALSESDENRVDSVSVLVFRVSDNQFMERRSVGDIETEQDSVSLKKFYVTLKQEATMDLVILANSQEIIRSAFEKDEDMSGLTKEEILEKLVLTYEGEWVNNSGNLIRPFPMWGFRNNVRVKDDDFTGANAIRMTRMVVRIDVHVLPEAQDDFKLKEIYLYNSYKQGKLAHSMKQGWDNFKHKATEPDIPTGATTSCPNSFCKIPYTEITTPDISSERVIYTLEAPAGSEDNLLGATALVIGGLYEGTMNYYRVDFMEQKSGNNQFIPLIRNHNYEINIQEVKGIGYENPDDAFRKGMTNMELDIVAWDGANMGNITFGAQHQLVVNTDSFFFYSNGRPQILKVFTDHPENWKVELDPQQDLSWLSITPAYGDSGVQTDVTLSAEVLAIPQSDREGYFYIRAGGLRKKIKVYQSLEAELYLHLEPELLVFRKSASISKAVTITVDPEDRPVYISWAGSPELEWELFPETGKVGQTIYTFKPKVNNSGNMLSGIVTFMISDDAGNSTTRTLSILQTRDDSRFDITYQYTPYYPALGGDDLWMRISSEFSWQIWQHNIKLNNVITNILIPQDNYTEHAGGLYQYEFKLDTNPDFKERTVELVATSNEPDFEPVTIQIKQDYTRPKLELLEPKTGTISFTNMQPADVTFRVNTDWFFNVDNNYERIIKNSTGTPSQIEGGGTIHDPQDFTVGFTPHIYNEEPGTPAGGTNIESTIRFSTANHDPASPSQSNVVISQSIPYFFNENYFKVRGGSPDGKVLVDGDTIPRDSYPLYIESQDNTAWMVQVRHIRNGREIDHPANKLLTQEVSSWSERQVEMVISPTQNYTSDSLAIKLLTAYKTTDEGGSQPKNVGSDTPIYMLIHKSEFYVDTIEIDARLTDPDYVIPVTGGTYEIKVTGKFPAIEPSGNNGYLGICICAQTESPEGSGDMMNSWYVKPSDGGTVPHSVNIPAINSNEIKEIYLYITEQDENKDWTTKKWRKLLPYPIYQRMQNN